MDNGLTSFKKCHQNRIVVLSSQPDEKKERELFRGKDDYSEKRFHRVCLRYNSQAQALHTYRINLSPFTKDFRVWGATIEIAHISFRLSSDGFLSKL